jgi:tRNA A-37 threonylcarbamoyl transferase component Bud32
VARREPGARSSAGKSGGRGGSPEIEPGIGLEIQTERFETADWTGEIAAWCRPADPEALTRELDRLTDPGAARKTLHWGRNYLYVSRLETPQGPLDVVVKQFRNQGPRRRLDRRWRGSKAERSWRVARALRAAGIATPEPLALIESRAAEGPSWYVCRHLPDALEARYLFRAANAGSLPEAFPGLDFAAFVTALAGTARRLHDAGFWHRDLSGGNVLLPAGQAGEPRDLYLLDLNRTRVGQRLGTVRRSRDLCRLALFRREHQELLLAAYWGNDRVDAWKRGLYRLFHRAFLWKNRVKPQLRALLGGPRRLAEAWKPRRAHAHIPAAPADAGAREKIVWDHLSDQPHQHAGRLEKLGVRLADLGAHAGEAAVIAGALPRIWTRYRQIQRTLRSATRPPVPWQGAGVAVRPWPERPEAVPELLAELGLGPVLLRLHPWQSDHGPEEDLARELHARGHELTFALPQDRALVRDPERWRAAIEELAERFTPYGRRFQVGQAINRSKWGVWNLREYVALATAAMEVLRRHPGIEVLGPAVIDFEYHLTAAVLNLDRPGLRFDAVSALLYVDRRGAPENPQAGFTTVDKVALLQAIADTARNVERAEGAPGALGAPADSAARRSWLTEVNWPLWEGPHSPAGRAVSVDEETQADYLARYYLLTLGTGLVERVFWWQLAARGYGLVDPLPEGPRRRPAFQTLKTLESQLAGATLQAVLPTQPPAHLYLFRRPDGTELIAGWSAQGNAEADLPRPARRVIGRDGEPLPALAGTRVDLDPSTRYFELE